MSAENPSADVLPEPTSCCASKKCSKLISKIEVKAKEEEKVEDLPAVEILEVPIS